MNNPELKKTDRDIPGPTQQVLPSVCPLDCPDTCSLSVTVDNGTLLEVKGSRANPYTNGTICNKVARYYPEFVHGKGRLEHPLKRTGPRGSNQYQRISWENALELVHEGFSRSIKQFGPQSVMPFNYAGPHGELAGGSMDRRFFNKLGATQLDRGPLCGAVRGTAYTSLFGAVPGMPPEQAVHADLVIVWGNNVTVSNLHLAQVLKSVREAGGKVVIVDPKRTRIAEQSSLFLQIQPGTDVVLAMALAAELEKRNALAQSFIEQWTHGHKEYMRAARQYTAEDVVNICGIPLAQFKQLAEMYTGATNVAASFGNGIERGRSGGSGLRAGMALQALTGNHGRLGAGVIAKQGLAAPKTTARLQASHLVPEGTRTFNIVDVADKLQDKSLAPPVKALFIYNHNPVATHPDQHNMIRALMQEDLFIAASDIVMTDSTALADVILPAASHFEYADIYAAYGQNYLQRAEPVIPCVGESLPNTEIFRRLSARFGFTETLFQDDDTALINQAMDASHPCFNGVLPANIALDQAIEMQHDQTEPLILCKNVFPATKSGKIELFADTLEEKYKHGLPRYTAVPKDQPLTLISPSSSKRTNATFGGCSASDDTEIIEINPHDAKARGLSTGDMVSVHNARGKVNLKVVVTDATLAGVVYSPKGIWLRTSKTGSTINALIPSDIRTDIEDGACYNETFVEVNKIQA